MTWSEEDNILWAWVDQAPDIEDLGSVEEDYGSGVLDVRALRVVWSNQQVELRLHLPAEFPLRLPTIFIHNHNLLGIIPHVDSFGQICFIESEGVLLDADRPEAILQQSLELARGVVEAGLRGENQADFADEFDAYWGPQHPNRTCVLLQSPLGDQPLQLVITRRCENMFVASAVELCPDEEARLLGRAERTYRGVYVPLERASVLSPPGDPKACWTRAKLLDVLKNHVSTNHRERLGELFDLPVQRLHFLIFGAPRSDNHRTFFGVGWCSRPDKKKGPRVRFPLTANTHSSSTSRTSRLLKTFPLVFERIDPQFLVERGGGHPALLSRHVMIVGCGAVGSVIADLIVKTGVGRLSLVDFDRLELGNIHRNQLGAQYKGMLKTKALASELSRHFPHLQVDQHVGRVEMILIQNPRLFNDVDLVIFATGNHTVELEMNERLYTRQLPTAALFTWLEPLGIGGHALLTNVPTNTDRTGCFRCLFEDREDGLFWNKASFAAPEQNFAERTSGCSTSFVSFGGIDATRTACLASEIARQYLVDSRGDHVLASWKGDSTDFERQGFELSYRYRNSTQDTLDQRRLHYKSPVCPICSQTR